jgi:hypothetical protein
MRGSRPRHARFRPKAEASSAATEGLRVSAPECRCSRSVAAAGPHDRLDFWNRRNPEAPLRSTGWRMRKSGPPTAAGSRTLGNGQRRWSAVAAIPADPDECLVANALARRRCDSRTNGIVRNAAGLRLAQGQSGERGPASVQVDGVEIQDPRAVLPVEGALGGAQLPTPGRGRRRPNDAALCRHHRTCPTQTVLARTVDDVLSSRRVRVASRCTWT